LLNPDFRIQLGATFLKIPFVGTEHILSLQIFIGGVETPVTTPLATGATNLCLKRKLVLI
jgi:hypothetical protein